MPRLLGTPDPGAFSRSSAPPEQSVPQKINVISVNEVSLLLILCETGELMRVRGTLVAE